MMTGTSAKARRARGSRQVGPIKPEELRDEPLAGEQQVVSLGELVSALYEAARTETDDDDEAAYLAALSTMDLLLRSRNSRALMRLLNP